MVCEIIRTVPQDGTEVLFHHGGRWQVAVHARDGRKVMILAETGEAVQYGDNANWKPLPRTRF